MNNSMSLPARVILLLCLLGSAAAYAEDFVLMKNGDRLTGEIKKIWNGEVFIDPAYGDEYAIELEYVAYVHTDEDFEVTVRRGRRTETLIGRLDIDDQQNPVMLAADGRSLPLREIDNMVEIEDYFDWKVRSDVSANISTGNTDTSSTRLNSVVEVKVGEHRHSLEFTRDEQRTDGDLTKDQYQILYQDTWTFTDDWFVRGSVNWSRDPIRDLTNRTRLFVGPGYHFWDDSKRTLNLSIGPDYMIEEIGIEKDKSLAAQVTLRYEQKFLRDDLVVYFNNDLSRIITGRKNRILDSKLGVRYNITDDFYVNMEVDRSYESNPADSQLKEDITYILGVGLELD
jgi:putative salt-induced outer membrane protein YdiY